MLLGSNQKERYDQMDADINFRKTDFWFYRSEDSPHDQEMNAVVDFLITEFMHVGPFGSHFVKEYQGNLRPMFYGIPLTHTFIYPSLNDFDAMAFVSNNPASSVLMKGVVDYFRNPTKAMQFRDLNIHMLAIQKAISPENEQEIVVGMDYLERLEPLAIYDHPSNGRLLMAMQGEEVPDTMALAMAGTRFAPEGNLHDLYMEATNLYNDYELGDIRTEAEFSQQLFALVKG